MAHRFAATVISNRIPGRLARGRVRGRAWGAAGEGPAPLRVRPREVPPRRGGGRRSGARARRSPPATRCRGYRRDEGDGGSGED